MKGNNMLKTLLEIAEKAEGLAEFIKEKGTQVQYEVEFVGGTYPVDTPHTSAGHLAEELKTQAENLFGSLEFDRLIFLVEEAEERYQDEYDEAVRELDLRK